MNPKIRELAEKAGSTNKQSLGVYQFFAFELENFSEMIADECARLAAATPCPYVADDRMIQNIGHTWDMACVAAAKEIRENFKVK